LINPNSGRARIGMKWCQKPKIKLVRSLASIYIWGKKSVPIASIYGVFQIFMMSADHMNYMQLRHCPKLSSWQ
jgi:hypothetical protein